MTLNLTELAEAMKDMDTCLLCTHADSGLDARPMSNNQDVAWDGTSWFFTERSTGAISQITADPRVMVTYSGPGLWVAVSGQAVLHDDTDLMKEHWDPDIERWFEQGIDTPGLVLIEVQPSVVRYWSYDHGDGTIDV